MTGLSRFLIVAVGTTAALWLCAQAIGVNVLVLQRAVIVFAFIGVIVAAALESILKRRASEDRRIIETPLDGGVNKVSPKESVPTMPHDAEKS